MRFIERYKQMRAVFFCDDQMHMRYDFLKFYLALCTILLLRALLRVLFMGFLPRPSVKESPCVLSRCLYCFADTMETRAQ